MWNWKHWMHSIEVISQLAFSIGILCISRGKLHLKVAITNFNLNPHFQIKFHGNFRLQFYFLTVDFLLYYHCIHPTLKSMHHGAASAFEFNFVSAPFSYFDWATWQRSPKVFQSLRCIDCRLKCWRLFGAFFVNFNANVNCPAVSDVVL